MRPVGSKFISGTANQGVLILTRADGTTAPCGVVIVRGVSLVDNADSTVDLIFDGS